MRKMCEKCNKKTTVIFDTTLNKSVCKVCKTPFPEQNVTKPTFKKGDKVRRFQEFNYWPFEEDTVVTVRKVTSDGSLIWLEEHRPDGELMNFWESRSFELVK